MLIGTSPGSRNRRLTRPATFLDCSVTPSPFDRSATTTRFALRCKASKLAFVDHVADIRPFAIGDERFSRRRLACLAHPVAAPNWLPPRFIFALLASGRLDLCFGGIFCFKIFPNQINCCCHFFSPDPGVPGVPCSRTRTTPSHIALLRLWFSVPYTLYIIIIIIF